MDPHEHRPPCAAAQRRCGDIPVQAVLRLGARRLEQARLLGQLGAYWVASRSPLHDAGGCGARHRRLPWGEWRRAARETCSRRGRPRRAPRRRWCLQSGLHPRPKQRQPSHRRTLRASARPARRTSLRAAPAVSGTDSCLSTPSLRIAVRNGDAPARQARPCGPWSTHGRCGTGHGHTSAQGARRKDGGARTCWFTIGRLRWLAS